MRLDKTTAAQAGFTLVELITVFAVISILSLLTIRSVFTAKVKAEISKAQTDFYQLNQAIKLFTLDHHHQPPSSNAVVFGYVPRNVESMDELTTPVVYLSTLPVSPWQGKNLFIRNQMDDAVQSRIAARTGNAPEDDWTDYPDYTYSQFHPQLKNPERDWVLYSYGPVRVTTSLAYHPSNGLTSIGSIYLTGSGISSSMK